MGEAAVTSNQSGYVNSEVLVSTDWVSEHLEDPSVRIIESNEDVLLYSSGHIPGAVEVDWVRDLNDQVTRDYISAEAMSDLLVRLGVDDTTTVVLYGDKSNWWATFAFWVFSLYGLKNLKIMNGGRHLWEKEGRPLTKDKGHTRPVSKMKLVRNDAPFRTLRDEVLTHVKHQGPLIDVRSPEEFSGEKLHMENYPNEGALRGGHIKGAKNVPWAKATDPATGTFKSVEDLRKLYVDEIGLKTDGDTIVYCRIGERSSHTWFVLKYLLGFSDVKNYDGSWTEYGNLVGAPIER